MKNALAVYTSTSSLNGRKLAAIAGEYGIVVRLLALGGYLPGNADEIQNTALANVNGGALLLVGAFELDASALARFDELNSQEARQKRRALRLFGPSEVEKRRAFLEEALEGAQREGITLDEWVRAQHFDPALSERAEWAGLNDDLLLAMTPRGRGRAA